MIYDICNMWFRVKRRGIFRIMKIREEGYIWGIIKIRCRGVYLGNYKKNTMGGVFGESEVFLTTCFLLGGMLANLMSQWLS